VKIPTLTADNFPAWADEIDEAKFQLLAEDFNRGFKRVRFAVHDSIMQPHLCGVHLDYHEGRLHFVATNKQRLAVSGMLAPEGAEDCPKVVVPTDAVDAALDVFQAATAIDIALNARAICFSADGLRLSARLIDAPFPAYEKAIPARGCPGFLFKRTDFVECIERANIMLGTNELEAVIGHVAGDELTLQSRNHAGGEATEVMPVVPINGEVADFALNPRVVAPLLASLGTCELAIECPDGGSFALIYSDDAPDFVGMFGFMKVKI
jgi:DNA polymerase-3 subunit beta